MNSKSLNVLDEEFKLKQSIIRAFSFASPARSPSKPKESAGGMEEHGNDSAARQNVPARAANAA